MKKYKVVIRTEAVGSECEDFIEVPDDISDEDLESECYEAAMGMAEWWYKEVKE